MWCRRAQPLRQAAPQPRDTPRTAAPCLPVIGYHIRPSHLVFGQGLRFKLSRPPGAPTSSCYAAVFFLLSRVQQVLRHRPPVGYPPTHTVSDGRAHTGAARSASATAQCKLP